MGGGLLAALLFVAIWWSLHPARPHLQTSDLYTHLSVSRHLLRGEGFLTDVTYPLSFAFDFARELPQPLIYRGPGFALLLTTAVARVQDDPAAVLRHVRWLQIFFLGLMAWIGIGGHLARHNFPASAAWLVMLMMSPLLDFSVDWAFVELPAALLLLLLWLRHRDVLPAGPGVVDGLLLGALTLLRWDLVWIPLLWWIWGRQELKTVARRDDSTIPAFWSRRLLLALLMVLLANLPWLLRNHQLTGNPFFTLQSQSELVKDTRTWPEYSVYRQLEPQPLLKVLSEDPVPILRKFVRGLKFYFRSLGCLFPWVGLVVMALALMVYLRGGIDQRPCPLRPQAEHPMSIIPHESPLGPLVVAGLTLLLMIVQYSFFNHSLRHLLVLYPLVAWEFAMLVGQSLGGFAGKWKINRWVTMIPVVLLTMLVIRISLEPLPGWKFAAEQAQLQSAALKADTNQLKQSSDAVPFVGSSAAVWYADRPAVWDPENEETRNLIRGLLTQPSVPTFADSLIAAAEERTRHQVVYDGSYQSLDYPGGDVADNRGVCTDVIIRSYRAVGIDLQKVVHEDMVADFCAYPDLWNLSRPDANIDHRRVPNLQRFFERRGSQLPITAAPGDFLPGDLVTWMLPGNLPHIGIVGHKKSRDGRRRLVIHNVGRGPQQEDFLFEYPITGHYRFSIP